MNSTTKSRRLAQLIKEIKNHSHREELLRLMAEQQADDHYAIVD